jgi:hypothetical protein
MKSMYIAFLAVAVIAVLANFGLDYAGFSASERTSGPSVRLD